MEFKFRVYSGGWEVEVDADSPEDAAINATKQKYEELGELFNIGFNVVVVKKNSNLMKVYPSVAIFEDLGMYRLSKEFRKLL